MGLDYLKEEISGTLNNISGIIAANPVTSTVVGGSLAAGAVLGTVALIKRKRKKKSKRKASRKKSSTRRGRRRRSSKKRRTHKYARTAGKRKDTSHKRIRMTKNGQPYIILKSGKARFIKRSSARRSRKMKGGRY